MTVREHDLHTSRIRAKADRVQIPLTRKECQGCKKVVAGVTNPWGKTEVCGKAECQLYAQAKDKGLNMQGHQLALLPGSRKTYYCGMVVAYEGDKKWTLGLVEDKPERRTDWLRGLSFGQLVQIQSDVSGRIVRKTEREINSYTEGPH